MNSLVSTNNKKPYCRACHKAGKTELEYTSHWTRSSPGSGGVITCPLILDSECGYCHDIGHWTKFCPLISAKTDGDGVGSVQKKKAAAVAVVVVADAAVEKKNNIYDCLNEDTDTDTDGDDVEVEVEAEVQVVVDTKIPVVGWKKALGMEPNLVKVHNWKAALTKPPVVDAAVSPVVAAETPKFEDTVDSFPSLASSKKIFGSGVEGSMAAKWASFINKKPIEVSSAPTLPSMEEMRKVFKGRYNKNICWADVESDDEEEEEEEDYLPVGELCGA